jgi:localization factor PodJL
MDQRTIESLLRRLVERVENSERRYGEALDQLHARLDRLSQTTGAARGTRPSEDAETFDRLHNQVSNLARRLERDNASPLDDFERLGKVLLDGLHQDMRDAPPERFGYAPEPFAHAAAPSEAPAPEAATEPQFPDFDDNGHEPHHREPDHRVPPAGANGQGSFDEPGDLDMRVLEMAQRLEKSIDTAMPTAAIQALSTRLDELGSQLSQTLEQAPTREALDRVERQLSDIGQQVRSAEQQLGRIAGIESHLIKLIERLDEGASAPAPQMDPARFEEIADKAATKAARLVAAEARQGTDRIDAMQRELNSLDGKNRERSDRLVSTLEAVHESLRQLALQVERGSADLQRKPRAPFLEQPRQTQAKVTPAKAAPAKAAPAQATPAAQAPKPQARPAGMPVAKAPAPAPAKTIKDAQAAPKETLRDRLKAASPAPKEEEAPQPFGRAKRPSPVDEAVDLDSAPAPGTARTGLRQASKPSPSAGSKPASSPSHGKAGAAKEKETTDNLVAAARRAAQAAALRAEGRGRRTGSPKASKTPDTEQPGRRRRSALVIAAAALLVLSAALLYGRLMMKPETMMPTTEQTMPASTDAVGSTTAPEGGKDSAPAPKLKSSGWWTPLPNTGKRPTGSAQRHTPFGVTDIAKSTGGAPAMPASELSPEPQLVSLQPAGQAPFPPGVTFSIEDPAQETESAPQKSATSAKLPLPPKALGPLALREAAAAGDANAQYIVATRYAAPKGPKHDLIEAARWLKRAAKAGLPLAQYRLAAMYERGLGVTKDLDRARKLYAAAAEEGNVKAMHNLAVAVSGRDGNGPDYALAAKWYAKAAAFGLADSQFNLGILSEHGLGRAKNLTDAYQWFSLAAARGNAEAAKRREIVKVQLAPATLAKAEAAIKDWKPKPALAKANRVIGQPEWTAAAPATENASLVTRAQTLLDKLGYKAGPADGLMGSRTRTAIKLFQSRNGLGVTGEVSAPLVTKLEGMAS